MGTRIEGGTVATTRAGDGYERRAFSAVEIYRMQELGIIDDDEGFELIEGDIVMMQSKNAPHERIKLALNRALARTLPTRCNSASRPALSSATMRFSSRTCPCSR